MAVREQLDQSFPNMVPSRCFGLQLLSSLNIVRLLQLEFQTERLMGVTVRKLPQARTNQL